MGELYECRNCLNVDTLTIHGRCNHCDSDSVISLEVLELLVRSKHLVGTTPAALSVMALGRA